MVLSGRFDARLLQLPVALGFDHRVVADADAGRFTNSVIEVLEDPRQFLLEA